MTKSKYSIELDERIVKSKEQFFREVEAYLRGNCEIVFNPFNSPVSSDDVDWQYCCEIHDPSSWRNGGK